MIFDFVVPGIPRTIQTKKSSSRQKWREAVSLAAKENWTLNQGVLAQELSAVIIHFYTETTTIDVDGIGKLVLDALKGDIIEDDNIVSQVTLRKTDQIGLLVSNPPARLATALGVHENFVYISLCEAPDHAELPI